MTVLRRLARDPRRDAGMATAEFAIVLPVIVAVLFWIVGTVAVGLDQIRCVDAARLAARSLARSDSDAVALGLARSAAPSGATITVSSAGDRITATVSSRRTIGGLGGWTATSSATAAREVMRAALAREAGSARSAGTAAAPCPVKGAPRRSDVDV